jgi:hypothetical protein
MKTRKRKENRREREREREREMKLANAKAIKNLQSHPPSKGPQGTSL